MPDKDGWFRKGCNYDGITISNFCNTPVSNSLRIGTTFGYCI